MSKKEQEKNVSEIIDMPSQEKDSADVAVREEIELDGVDSWISRAIASNMSVEALQSLLNMHERLKAEKAREAFIVAMGKFQKDCPTIEKKKPVYNKDGKTIRYKFAPLDSIVDQVREFIAKHGLSYSVKTVQDDNFVTAICIVTHELGHHTTSSFKVPVDKDGYMSQPQKFASALTFAKRYAFCNAFGIMTGDEDNDANTSEAAPVSAPQMVNPKPVYHGGQFGHCPACGKEIQAAYNFVKNGRLFLAYKCPDMGNCDFKTFHGTPEGRAKDLENKVKKGEFKMPEPAADEPKESEIGKPGYEEEYIDPSEINV